MKLNFYLKPLQINPKFTSIFQPHYEIVLLNDIESIANLHEIKNLIIMKCELIAYKTQEIEI